MELTVEMVRQTLARFNRRVAAIRAMGGIALCDHVNGTPIPPGWKLDVETAYFIPPNVTPIGE